MSNKSENNKDLYIKIEKLIKEEIIKKGKVDQEVEDLMGVLNYIRNKYRTIIIMLVIFFSALILLIIPFRNVLIGDSRIAIANIINIEENTPRMHKIDVNISYKYKVNYKTYIDNENISVPKHARTNTEFMQQRQISIYKVTNKLLVEYDISDETTNTILYIPPIYIFIILILISIDLLLIRSFVLSHKNMKKFFSKYKI